LLRRLVFGRKVAGVAEVLNVVFGSPDWRARLLSNFALAPFELWGERFASVEGFWQGLKFPEGSAEQKRVFALSGYEAKRAGRRAPAGPGGAFTWRSQTYRVGSLEHWDLMRQALRAKFEQNVEARRALMATVGLRLVHVLPRDSRTIPGAVFARMLEEIRAELGLGGMRDTPSGRSGRAVARLGAERVSADGERWWRLIPC